MSPMMVAIFCLLTGILCSLLHTILKPSPQQRPLPPGPRPLPVIGNLHMLGSLPHRALRALALKHGPIMSLHLGSVPTVVVSSSAGAEQVLRAHDAAFASRPKLQVAEYVSYGAKGISLTEYGPYWKFARRLCAQRLLSASRIASFAPLRWREVGSAVEALRAAAERSEAVDLSERVNELVEEMSFKMVVGSDVDIVGFKGLAKEGVRLIGTFNLADYVPFLAALDLQGLTRQMVKLSKEIDKTLDKIISEVQQKTAEKKKAGKNFEPMSFIEVLLSLMNNNAAINDDPSEDQLDQHYTIELPNVKAMLGDMIGASYETSVTAIEWTLTRLIRHPEIMARVQRELEEVVGLERMVKEVDLPKLTYLDMVIMETLRLHPVSPFLVPHESIEDVEINGYFIPKKTRVLVNNWAIGRDPDVWSDNVEQFIPERFGNSEMGFKGNDFRYIPFGSGRRGCPGTMLGLTTIRLVVAQFVHCFSWGLPNGIVPSEMDMTERFGLTVPRANHLLAIPTYRLIS